MDSASLVLLAIALSLDSLTVGLLYGARGIRLSWGAIAIVSVATGLLLGAAMGGGQMMAAVLPAEVARQIGASILVAVGVWISYQTWRSHGFRTPEGASGSPCGRQVWRLRLGSVGLVIEILREPGAADIDRSGHINPVEACFLGVALALDSVAAGLGAAMAGFSPWGLPPAAAAGSFLFMLLGARGARLVPFRLEGRWSLVHGLVLVLLGVYRMMQA